MAEVSASSSASDNLFPNNFRTENQELFLLKFFSATILGQFRFTSYL